MDDTNTQKAYLQKVTDKHNAGVGSVYGGSSAWCALERSQTPTIGIAIPQAGQ